VRKDACDRGMGALSTISVVVMIVGKERRSLTGPGRDGERILELAQGSYDTTACVLSWGAREPRGPGSSGSRRVSHRGGE